MQVWATTIHSRPPLITEFQISDAEIADLIAFLDSRISEEFLADPAFADPWPGGHPASVNRAMPVN
ncbi:hypothetical protein [Yoonia vestfoldensis]|uniref:hypothetical protein n=1 Tax=Yoonia vestfoldensis TaxID=245188 RepID=UPI000477CA62|nr:hypothetical protein [Yoonia vestfoldensis]